MQTIKVDAAPEIGFFPFLHQQANPFEMLEMMGQR